MTRICPVSEPEISDSQRQTVRSICSLLFAIILSKKTVFTDQSKFIKVPYCSLFHGFWQSFVTIGLCNHLMRIISTYVGNTKKSEIS